MCPIAAPHPRWATRPGGTVQGVMMGLPPILPQAREGRLRILGVMSSRRNANIPDAKTFELRLPRLDLSNSVWYRRAARRAAGRRRDAQRRGRRHVG